MELCDEVVLGDAHASPNAFTWCAALDDTTEREKAAKEVAASFVKELGEAMTREMTKGGPTEAIKVCAELAPEIAGRFPGNGTDRFGEP